EPGSSLGRAPRASSRKSLHWPLGSRTDASSTRSMASSTKSWRPSSAPTAAGLRSAWPCGTCWRTFAARAPAAPRPGPRCGISTPRLRLSRSAWSSAAI
ncbi:unnamed protein product, partial [Effrenium voratum]